MLDSFPITFTASIEFEQGVSFQHPYHLGTIEPMARRVVDDIFYARVGNGLPVLTIALKFDGKIVDVYDGKEWWNEYLAKLDAEMEPEWA